MSEEYPSKSSRVFSDREARQILSRAAELDVSDGTSFSAVDLHRIAADASIAPGALEAALQEALDTRAASGQRRGNKLRGLALLVAGVGLGVLTLVMDRMSLGQESAAAVFGPSAAVMLTLALKHRWHGSFREFTQEAVVLLGFFTLSVVGLEGFHALQPALSWSALSVVLGGIIVGVDFRPRGNPASRARYGGAA